MKDKICVDETEEEFEEFPECECESEPLLVCRKCKRLYVKKGKDGFEEIILGKEITDE